MNSARLAVLLGTPKTRRGSDRVGRGVPGRRDARRRWLLRLIALLLLLAAWFAFVEGPGPLL